MPPFLITLVSSPRMGKPQYGIRPILSGTVPQLLAPRVPFSISVAFATDTHTAGTFGRIKVKAVVFATDTHTAATLVRVKTKALASALDTSTAGTVGRSKKRALVFATDTHTAGVLGSTKGAIRANWLHRLRKKYNYQ